MADYQKMYLHIFNAVSEVVTVLQKAQQATEAMYANADDTPITLPEKNEETP